MCIIESLIFAKNNCCAFAPGIQELCPGFVENEILIYIEPPPLLEISCQIVYKHLPE